MNEMLHHPRRLLFGRRQGVLSTYSVEVAGYPFGSLVPYCLDGEGQPVLLISPLAEHYKNVRANPKVSLTILDGGDFEIQTEKRLTYCADAAAVGAGEPSVRERYYRYFPAARAWGESLGFVFYRLKPVRLRFIGGFGKALWADPAECCVPNPFSPEAERRMLIELSRERQDRLRRACERLGKVKLKAGQTVSAVGIDGGGVDVRAGRRILRFSFETFVSSVDKARDAAEKLIS